MISASAAVLLLLPQAPEEKKTYALAVVPVTFADRAWGGGELPKLVESLTAYLSRASSGRFALQAKVGDPVALGVERARFADRDLAPAVPAGAYDGVAFVAAGPIGARGTPLWPHKASLRHGGRKVEYLLLTEEPADRAPGIAAHEFMHLLGLPDKYDDEKAEVGKWCILGTGYNEKDPAPPCADCRVKLGWSPVVEADPRRDSTVQLPAGRVLRVPVNADSTESLLLEVRERVLVWHLGGGKKIELLGRYPGKEGDRLTPLSDPPFRGRTAGAWPVWITEIRLDGGRAAFKVGPSAPLTALEEKRRSQVGRRIGE